jgi:hypothetical protein
MASKGAIEPASLADFNAAMRHFAAEVKGDMEMVTREQIRLMCRDAMTFTPPMPKGGGQGLTAKAHTAGMGKTAKDIKRIFIPADSPKKALPVLLRRVINSVRGDDRQAFMDIYSNLPLELGKRRGISPVMRKILEDVSWERSFAKAKNYLNKANIFGQVKAIAGFTNDLRGIHDKYKGAVGGRWPKGARLGGPQYMVGTTQQLEAYIAERQYKVGRVKAGWAAVLSKVPMPVTKKGVARNFGAYNAPWVDANKRSAQGVFSATRSPGFVSMTIMNMIGNINNVAGKAGTENLVYGNRVKQMRAAVLERLEKTLAQANARKTK